MASKEDPAVQFWEFVQENLLQFYCENVSWEQASDKIHIKVVVELLGDLVTHVNTCLLLRMHNPGSRNCAIFLYAMSIVPSFTSRV